MEVPFETMLNRIVSLSIALEGERSARIIAENKVYHIVQAQLTDLRATAADQAERHRRADEVEARLDEPLTGCNLRESKNAVESVMNASRSES